MTNLLVRLFVKDYQDMKKASVREGYGVLSGAVGIACNLLLFLLKFFAGVVTGAVSISADAFNNLSDAGSSVVTLIGFRLAGKPADPDHPYGHGRIEYISGFIVSAAIVIMGVELLKTSVGKILHPSELEFSIVAVVILAGSILMKLWMCVFTRKLGKKIDSSAMIATSTDSLSDCISTTAVLAALLIYQFTDWNIDGIAGAVVALFVLFAGYSTAKDTLQPLLGQPPEPEFVRLIEDTVMAHREIIGVHDLMVHNYGPGRLFASLHAEIPYTMDMLEAHDIIDMTEKEVRERCHCDISIHMDPVVTDNEEVNTLKRMTQEVLQEIDPVLRMHDFRITGGPLHNNLIFDMVVPFQYKYSDKELVDMVNEAIAKRRKNCYAVIDIDKDFIGVE